MIRMNAAAEIEGRSFSEAASLLAVGEPTAAARRSLWDAIFDRDFLRLTREHLLLVFVSLAASVAVGEPAADGRIKTALSAVLIGRETPKTLEGGSMETPTTDGALNSQPPEERALAWLQATAAASAQAIINASSLPQVSCASAASRARTACE